MTRFSRTISTTSPVLNPAFDPALTLTMVPLISVTFASISRICPEKGTAPGAGGGSGARARLNPPVTICEGLMGPVRRSEILPEGERGVAFPADSVSLDASCGTGWRAT